MSDTPIEKYLPIFASTGVNVSFLVPTPTGYEKSIMDATAPVRQLLLNSGIHNYEEQGQGQENKVMIKSFFVGGQGVTETFASLYRPVTKKNDPALADRVIEALFKAYFTDNKELADKELLQRIGEECGLDAIEVKDVLDTDKYRDEVLLDEREASRNGVHAVPFFVVGKFGISGAQSTEGMKATIMKAMEEAEPVMEQGMSCGPPIIVRDAEYLDDGDVVSLNDDPDFAFKVLYVPGHTTDSVLFYSEADHVAFVGDTIFKGSIGNYQYPGGNADDLQRSIIRQIFTLPDKTVLCSGHSEQTTVGAEKRRYRY